MGDELREQIRDIVDTAFQEGWSDGHDAGRDEASLDADEQDALIDGWAADIMRLIPRDIPRPDSPSPPHTNPNGPT
jgi:hypothetical protein